MSAREDAIRRSPRPSARLTTLVLATLAGIALGVAVALVTAPASLPLFRARVAWSGGPPVAGEWPEPVRSGESAAVALVAEGPGGAELHVLAPRAPRARRLAAGLAARRAVGAVTLETARESVTRRWRDGLAAAPMPPLSPQAECASLLLAEAARRRDLAEALPEPFASGLAEPLPADAEIEGAVATLGATVAAADVEGCRGALLTLAALEDSRFVSRLPEATTGAARGGTWRTEQLARAAELDTLAAHALAGQTPFQRELAEAGAAERTVTLSAALGDPYAPLRAAAPEPAVTVEPLAGPWAALLGGGGLAGGLVALLAAAFALRGRRRATGPAVAIAAPARDPGEPQPWVHVVAGHHPALALRAALELAAHALARRERVLLVDAGAGRLHERLGREARWGLMECLQGDMPVLGLVQYAGRPGFYLLARGHAARTAAWSGLGRCLDDARQHFGRLVFVIDRTTAREFGDSLAGRPLEGWYAAPGARAAGGAAELSARLGIAFSGIDLSGMPKATLEALSTRVTELAALLPPVAEPTPLEPVIPDVPVEPEVRMPPPEPVVLDCDLQVLQRLRFLAWMRRVQSESRQAGARAVQH